MFHDHVRYSNHLGTDPDPQKVFVISILLIFGLGLEILPALYTGVPGWLQPLASSSLTLSTVLAVVLNHVLRSPKMEPVKVETQ